MRTVPALIAIATLVLSAVSPAVLHANGVCFRDGALGDFLPVISSDVQVSVQNQVAVITTTQQFNNDGAAPFLLSYGFPVPEGASATRLAWKIGDEWQEANVAAEEPDSLPGGGETDPELAEYLGDTPLVFACGECDLVPPGESFEVSLTYVQLLPYAFGEVSMAYPNDYRLIQPAPFEEQHLTFTLGSLRQIEFVMLASHVADTNTNDGSLATVTYSAANEAADADYRVVYRLSLDELGLFDMSTWLAEEDVPDSLGRGFFTFIAEPEPDTSVVIEKVFTLMVDRSGSMSGQKIVQARDAATFIVDNLNAGDRFNIVDFASTVRSFAASHVDYTEASRADAVSYVSQFLASGSTNISGAFDVAVPQFGVATDSTANIIIFFTDGRPTTGVRDTEQLLARIRSLVLSTETDINLFVLGIGGDVNTELLARMATENAGFARFLRDDEVEDVITGFYLQIQNPVLLNTAISVSPPGAVVELFPDPLPNLYQGVQMIVSGRYQSPADVSLTLSGTAFGAPVDYTYDVSLAGGTDEALAFLPRLWAKSKIEHLLIAYYATGDAAEQEALRAEIVQLSLAYGVLSPFTSFTEEDPGDTGTPVEDEVIVDGVAISLAAPYVLLGNRPNPFNPRTTISFLVGSDLTGPVSVRIFDVRGRFVRELFVQVSGPGRYDVVWDGTYQDGTRAASGVYLYVIDFGEALLSGKMLMVN